MCILVKFVHRLGRNLNDKKINRHTRNFKDFSKKCSEFRDDDKCIYWMTKCT